MITRTLFFFLALSLTLGACAGRPAAPKASLENRVAEYVRLRDAADLDALYLLFSPAYRAQTTRNQFIRKYNMTHTNSRVESITVQDRKAEVVVIGDARILGVNIPGQRLTTSWVLVDEEWYIEPKKP